MPRKKPASYRPTVHNLGSPEGGLLDFGREEIYARMDPSLGRKAAALPVYLVNPDQMDRLYPPERRRTFCDPERVRRALRDLRSRGEEGEEDRGLLWEALRDGSECPLFRRTVAVGLYMRSLDGVSKGSVLGLGDPGHQDPGAPPAFQADPGPAIFLCPERIVDWGAREGVPTALVQDQVYYHELAHALMDTADTAPDPYQEPWGLVVEESLANWVAASRFQGSEALAVHRLIKGQPPEYLGYEAVSRLVFFSREPIARYLLFWEDVLEDFLRRRGYFYWRDVLEDVLRFIRRGYSLPFLPFPLPFLPLSLSERGGLAPLNLEVWREAKRRGDWQHPEVENLWEEFALRLLEEGVF
jgi:hypothetical protein